METLIKTKILSTLGPACNSEETIAELIRSGVRTFRVNSSHGKPEDHDENINRVRKVSKELGIYVGILLDLQGPKIRVGTLAEPLQLVKDEEYIIKHMPEPDGDKVIPVDYPSIANDVKPGDRILLDDGKIELKTIKAENNQVLAKIVFGGKLTSRKGLNIPGTTASLSAVTPRDVDFIKFGVERNVDYMALSFVRSKDDILKAKSYIHEFGGEIPVIAKIEKPQAVENLISIITAADGVMVARGDLGIEISPEQVPIVQKKIIEEANTQRKVVITATQMLESMIVNPTPTRAEASDVANAIMDGTDAVMLSGETAVGAFPVNAVKMMSLIANNVEASDLYPANRYPARTKEIFEMDSQAIASAVIRMLSEVEIDGIVAFTRSGFTARLLSKAKPSVPIIAITDNEVTCRRLSLLWGVFPYLMDFQKDFSEELIRQIDQKLIKETSLRAGDKVIITGGLPHLNVGKTNFIRLHQLGSPGVMY